MTVDNHTAIPLNSAATTPILNAPLAQLDAAMGNVASLTLDGASIVAGIGTAAPTTTAQTLVGAINEMNAALAAIGGASDAQLVEWTEGGDYEATAVTYDADNVVTTATVKWPDGSAGTFTTTSKNATWLAIDAYTITHTTAGKTVTQAAVTRDASGNVTIKPALSVA